MSGRSSANANGGEQGAGGGRRGSKKKDVVKDANVAQPN